MVLRRAVLLRARASSATVFAVGGVATGSASGSAASCHSDTMPTPEATSSLRLEAGAGLSAASALATISSSASIVAAAAPAMCAVHCAAMPVLTVLMPSMGAAQLFGGMCMHAFGRKVAYYFVVPLGLVSNAINFPQHQVATLCGVCYVCGVSV